MTLDHWSKMFGLLYSLWLGNQLFVIVSDPQIAKDLMVTNGAIFSSRKEMFIKSKTIFAGRGITATPYNSQWYVQPQLNPLYIYPTGISFLLISNGDNNKNSKKKKRNDDNYIYIFIGKETVELQPEL